jgi:predicted outer membrane repeat protein
MICSFSSLPRQEVSSSPDAGNHVRAKKLSSVMAAGAFTLFMGMAGQLFAAGADVTTAADSGPGSLRAAISAAPSGSTLTFDSSLDGQTITLASEIILDNKTLTIDATALPSGCVISGNNATRLLRVTLTGNLTLRKLTLRQGNGTGAADAGVGGAIYNGGTTVVDRCTFERNYAGVYGGAIYNAFERSLTVMRSTFTVNSTILYGGAVANTGFCTITGSTFEGNTSNFQGGAVYTDSQGSLTVRNSTLVGNTASFFGGALFVGGASTMEFLTVTRNTTNQSGGGIFRDSLGTLSLSHSIVALNQAPTNPQVSGLFLGSPNFLEGDPKLSDLQAWGGPTKTMMPLPDSPVIDAGGFTALSTDQRGLARILGDAVDIGAVEVASKEYDASGTTLYARVPVGDTDGVFEISTDPLFLPFVTTYAGTGAVGFTEGPRASALMGRPAGVAVDAAGNVFIADSGNNVIRMVGSDGRLVTIAGSGVYGISNGPGPLAQFAYPTSLAVGPDNNLYVADTFNHRICKITRPVTPGGLWTVSSLAGSALGEAGSANGNGTNARFNFPYGLDVDGSGNVYVADSGNHRIRKITPGGTVTLYAGSGTAGSSNNVSGLLARFNQPKGLVIEGANIYVADTGNHLLRKIVPDGANAGAVTTLAGSTMGFTDGLASAAQFNGPSSLGTDDNGRLYVADEGNHSIRRVSIAGEVETEVGLGTAGFVNGDKTIASFDSPTGVAIDADGNLLIADTDNNCVRRVDIKPMSVSSTVIAGSTNADGIQVTVDIDFAALGLDPLKTYYFRWKSNTTSLTLPLGHSFFTYELPTVATAAATNLIPTSARLNALVDPKQSVTTVVFEYSTDPNMLPPYAVRSLAGSTTPGYVDAQGASAAFFEPNGMAVNAAGEVFVADRLNHRIRKITPAGLVSTFAGSGSPGFLDDTGLAAEFENPNGLALDSLGNLYVADEANHCIRRITPAGVVTTFAGSGIAGFQDGTSGSARFLYPTGVAVDSANHVYVADSGNHRIRKIDAVTGAVSTFAGSGLDGVADGAFFTAQFSTPVAIAVNAFDDVLVLERGSNRVRLVSLIGVSTLAGDNTAGLVDGLGTAARFSSPTGITVGPDGNAYIADRGNHCIRRLTVGGEVTTIAGSGVAGTVDSPTIGLSPAIVTQFDSPTGIVSDASGALYITQAGMVRKLARAATVPRLTSTPPSVGSGVRNVFSDIVEPLLPGHTYYFRAIGTSYRGTVTGSILSFTTPVSGVVLYDGANLSDPTISHEQVDAVDYGDTPTGQPVTRSFTIFNPGSWPLNVTSITAPFGYQVIGGTGVIPGANAVTFTVVLTAAAEGTYPGNVTILSDATEQPVFSFPVTGLVLDPPVVVTLDATDLASGSATFRGTVNPKGSETQTWFEWSLDPEFDGVGVSTFAGSTNGFVNGVGVDAQFSSPSSMVIDASGNLYVADTLNHCIRKIAPDGTTTTYAGTGVAGFANGAAASAQFHEPIGLAIGSDGTLFVADSKNHRIRAISTAGNVTTYAGLGTAGFTDGIPTAARFRFPSGLAIDSSGVLFVADTMNHRIRKIATNGEVSTLAGTSTAAFVNGVVSVARFNQPYGIAVDAAGNAYVTEVTSHAIRKVEPNGTTSVYAGDIIASGSSNGPIASARFQLPKGLHVTAAGEMYVADRDNHLIRVISTTGVVATFAGTGDDDTINGNGDDAAFSQPCAVVSAGNGDVYVSQLGDSLIRKIVSLQTLLPVPGTFLGTTALPVSLAATGLPAADTYYYRLVATNGGGTRVALPKTVVMVSFTQWQASNFSNQLVQSGVADPLASPSGDGLSNLVKYALGLDPNVRATDGVPTLSREPGTLSLNYSRSLTATNVTIAIEWSTDLKNWSRDGVTTEVLSESNGLQLLRSSVSADTPSKFLRISVTQP